MPSNSFIETIKIFVWFMLVASIMLPLLVISAICGVIQEKIDKFIDWIILRVL